MTDTWDPAQYDKFQREREQPFFDLLAGVRPGPGMRVADLGCGTGALTRVLHQRLAARDTLGLDRSERMLANAKTEPLPAGLRFEMGTIEAFVADAPSQAKWDLIFSNAALQWVDNHQQLIPQLAAAVAAGGQLAFQMPAQHDTVSHQVADALTTVEPFASAFRGWRRSQPVLPPDAYARMLYGCGFEDPKVQLIVYPHVLASRSEVVEWVKGTLLTEYQRHLPSDLYNRFVAEYSERLFARLEDTKPFFYPFKRILCWGQRSA